MRSPRYHLLDSLRGLTLVSMILYHGTWDLVYLFGHDLNWYHGTYAFLWQQSICWTFILLSGFCWQFGRSKLRRGLTVLGGSVIISLVTILFMPDSAIRFGVLSLLGSAMVLMLPLDRICRKVPPLLGATAGFLLFVLLRQINAGLLGIGPWTVNLPAALYRNLFTAYLGFPAPDFSSSDYFPLLPWFFLFLTGYFLYSIAHRYGLLERLPKTKSGPLAWMGKHSLLIYLLHQPILYGVLYLLHLI